MDLRQYWRVIKRFKWVVIAGCALAFALTFLTVVRVQTSSPYITYRQSQTFSATEQLLLSEHGCSIYCTSPTPSADLGQLAILYAQLANSDIVRARVLQFGRPGSATYTASPVEDPTNPSNQLPIVAVNGLATSPREASTIAHRASVAFEEYLTANQNLHKVGGNQRINLTAITQPNRPVVVKGRKLTVPIVILLSLLILTFGLAFVLDNLKSEAAAGRVRELDASEPPDREVEPTVREVEPPVNGDGSPDEQQRSAIAGSRTGGARKTRV